MNSQKTPYNMVLQKAGLTLSMARLPQYPNVHSNIMKTLAILIFFVLKFDQLYSQKKECHCDTDTLMNHATVSCETQILRNKAKLYWQYTCDKIWLTLETIKGNKLTIDEVPVEYYTYAYRLGFHFVKEFDKSILFRSGCPANGPCIYSLIDKTSGKKINEFGQLIGIDIDINDKIPYPFDFLVYASKDYKEIVINYPDKKKVFSIPFDFHEKNLTAVIPEYQFDTLKLDGSVLTLYYTTTKGKELNLKIDLKNRKYSR